MFLSHSNLCSNPGSGLSLASLRCSFFRWDRHPLCRLEVTTKIKVPNAVFVPTGTQINITGIIIPQVFCPGDHMRRENMIILALSGVQGGGRTCLKRSSHSRTPRFRAGRTVCKTTILPEKLMNATLPPGERYETGRRVSRDGSWIMGSIAQVLKSKRHGAWKVLALPLPIKWNQAKLPLRLCLLIQRMRIKVASSWQDFCIDEIK